MANREGVPKPFYKYIKCINGDGRNNTLQIKNGSSHRTKVIRFDMVLGSGFGSYDFCITSYHCLKSPTSPEIVLVLENCEWFWKDEHNQLPAGAHIDNTFLARTVCCITNMISIWIQLNILFDPQPKANAKAVSVIENSVNNNNSTL